MSMQSPMPNNTGIHICLFSKLLTLNAWMAENFCEQSLLYIASISMVISTIRPHARSHLHPLGPAPLMPPSLPGLPTRTCAGTPPRWEQL